MSIPTPDPGPNDSGGFLISPLPTPTPSIASPPAAASVAHDAALPAARRTALRPGSAKYDHAARYVEDALFRIAARYARRFARRAEDEAAAAAAAERGEGAGAEERGGAKGGGERRGEERGYASFRDAAGELERVVEVLWVSGTPSLQIPFLLVLASDAASYLPAFPFAPSGTFALFRKLDAAFTALLAASSLDGRVMTMTEKVRLRGIVESTRVVVARHASEEDWEGTGRGAAGDDEAGTEAETETEGEAMTTDGDMDTDGDEDGEGAGVTGINTWEMEVARVYERTIVALGSLLDAGRLIGDPNA